MSKEVHEECAPRTVEDVKEMLVKHSNGEIQRTIQNCIQNLIIPYIGSMEMQKLKPYHMENLYATPSKTPCGSYIERKKQELTEKQKQRFLSGTTIHEVHRLARADFPSRKQIVHEILHPEDRPAPQKRIYGINYSALEAAAGEYQPADAKPQKHSPEDIAGEMHIPQMQAKKLNRA